MAIPTVGRSRADLVAPFDGEGRFAGLTIEHVEIFLGEDRIWEQFEIRSRRNRLWRALGRLLARLGFSDPGTRAGRWPTTRRV